MLECENLGIMGGINPEAVRDIHRNQDRFNQKILVVEGKRDKDFFVELFASKNLSSKYRVYSADGKDKLFAKIKFITEIEGISEDFALGVADPDYEFLKSNYSRINNRIVYLKENNFETFLVYNSGILTEQGPLNIAKMVAISVGKLRAYNYLRGENLSFVDKSKLERCIKSVFECDNETLDYDSLVINSFGGKVKQLQDDYTKTITKYKIPEMNIEILNNDSCKEFINGKDLINLLSIQRVNFNKKKAMKEIISKFHLNYLYEDMIELDFIATESKKLFE